MMTITFIAIGVREFITTITGLMVCAIGAVMTRGRQRQYRMINATTAKAESIGQWF